MKQMPFSHKWAWCSCTRHGKAVSEYFEVESEEEAKERLSTFPYGGFVRRTSVYDNLKVLEEYSFCTSCMRAGKYHATEQEAVKEHEWFRIAGLSR